MSEKCMRFFSLEGPVSRGHSRPELTLKHPAMFFPALSYTTRLTSLICTLCDRKEILTIRHVAEAPVPAHSEW